MNITSEFQIEGGLFEGQSVEDDVVPALTGDISCCILKCGRRMDVTGGSGIVFLVLLQDEEFFISEIR